MAQAQRGLRLKVFCTHIGIHSWVIAAPSQKAALAAWDVKENLFASGAARVVRDKVAVELAMRTPGRAVKLVAEHDWSKATRVVRLDDHRRTPAKDMKSKPAYKPKRAADRSKLDQAEDALAEFQKRTVRDRAAILRQQRDLQRKTLALEEDVELEEGKLSAALERARAKYEAEAP